MPRKKKTNLDSEIEEKLQYIGLTLDNIPEELQDEPISYRVPRDYEEKQYKQYKYIPVDKISILLSPTNRLDGLDEKYKKASPLANFLDNKNEENIIRHTIFLSMLKQMSVEEIKKLEKEQQKLAKEIPFKVKYEDNYLWQIYYIEATDRYFMLVPTGDTNYSAFFYLLKKKLEKKSKNYIYAPISGVDYSRNYLKKSEFKDIGNYIELFAKEWPYIYEVYDKQGNLSIHIIGETHVYGSIKSIYKIILENELEANHYYKLLKAMFILQTELPNYFTFTNDVDKNGNLKFYCDERQIRYNDMASFIKSQYAVSESLKTETSEKIEQYKEKLEGLKQIAATQEIEYIEKEKQISTFLECKKTFFGKFKYFFKYNKKNKKMAEKIENNIEYQEDSNEDNILTGSLSEILKARRKQKEQKIAMREKQIELQSNENIKTKNTTNLQTKRNCTIEEVIESYRELQKIENELKNVVMDINAIKLKNKNMAKKIENATNFIKEIDNHKRSIFEFWKYSNKDEISVLPEGEEEEVGVIKKIEKVFEYSEDFEQFGKDLDRLQRKVLTSEEMDNTYIATTQTMHILNKIITNTVIPKDIEVELKQIKKELKEEENDLDEEFDVFDDIVEDTTKIKKIKNQKYREASRNKFEILDVNKMTKQLEFKLNLEKVIQVIKDAFNSVKSPEDATIYKAINDEKIDENEFNVFNLNPQEEITEALETEGNEINLYKLNLKKGENVLGFTNIIYCNNKNKTLPIGMDFSTKVMLDLTKLDKKLKKIGKFHVAKFENESDDFSKIIVKDVLVYEEK